MTPKNVGASFANRPLFSQEAIKLAALYLAVNDWKAVQERALAEHVLPSRTVSNAGRLCRELVSRLKTLTHGELVLLVEGSPHDQGYILWIAVCRRYQLMRDFATEVLRDRYINLKLDLRHEHFDSFFSKYSEWNPGLEELQPATKSKLRQIVFKILRESGLIGADYAIRPAMLGSRLLSVIGDGDRSSLHWFPVNDAELWTLTR